MRPWRKRKIWQFRLSIGWAFYCTWLWRNVMTAFWALIGFPLVFALSYMLIEVMLFDMLDEYGLWEAFVTIVTFRKIPMEEPNNSSRAPPSSDSSH